MKKPMGDWKLTAGLLVLLLMVAVLAATPSNGRRELYDVAMVCGMECIRDYVQP